MIEFLYHDHEITRKNHFKIIVCGFQDPMSVSTSNSDLRFVQENTKMYLNRYLYETFTFSE